MSVQPNSLVFVVIVGIWAAFFVQHWVRRREHALTAHTVDQLSEAMRVLDGTERSTVKVTAHALAEPSARPSILAQRAADRQETVSVPANGGAAEPGRRAAVSGPPTGAVSQVARGPRPARPVRGVTFLAALLTTVVTLLLAPFGVVGWSVVAGAAVATLLALAWLRSCVQAEQRLEAARRAARAAQRRAAAAGPSASVGSRSSAAEKQAAAMRTPRPSVASVAEPRAAADDAIEAASAATVEPCDRVADPDGLATEEFVAVEVVSASASTVMTPVVDEDDIPLTWEPVPVPRPTYTMKVKAVPAAASTPPAGVEAGAAPAPVQDQGADTAYDDAPRRAVGS